MDRRHFLGGTAAAAASLAVGPVRAADDYPSHPITLINPFPPGGVVEDPATGAAAAAFGAYLADRGVLPASRAFDIRQGEDMGRPSRIAVSVPRDLREGVRVGGTAVRLAAD